MDTKSQMQKVITIKNQAPVWISKYRLKNNFACLRIQYYCARKKRGRFFPVYELEVLSTVNIINTYMEVEKSLLLFVCIGICINVKV